MTMTGERIIHTLTHFSNFSGMILSSVTHCKLHKIAWDNSSSMSMEMYFVCHWIYFHSCFARWVVRSTCRWFCFDDRLSHVFLVLPNIKDGIVKLVRKKNLLVSSFIVFFFCKEKFDKKQKIRMQIDEWPNKIRNLWIACASMHLHEFGNVDLPFY